MLTEKVTTLVDGRRVWTTALPGLDQDGAALLLGLSAVYDTDDRLLYREMHRKRDLEDVWMQHDGIVAGVQDGLGGGKAYIEGRPDAELIGELVQTAATLASWIDCVTRRGLQHPVPERATG